MNKYLVVTGFFNINRDKWESIYQRQLSKYFENAKRILSTPEDMVIFTSKDNIEFISENRNKSYFTHLVITNYEDLKYYKYEDRIKNIMLSESFKKLITHDVCKVPEFNNPEYLVVIWSKINLIKRAIEMFPDYTHFGWIDFGLHPHIIPEDYPPFYPKGIISDLIKIHCRSLPLETDSEINNFMIKSNDRLCAGSITGHKDNIIIFEYLLDRQISKLLDNNIVHCEQSIFTLIYLEHKGLFDLSFGDCWDGILRNYYRNCYYYFGSFGFFNAYVIGFLEKIKGGIEILTLYDYAQIIENEFPGKFKLYYTDSLFSLNRICYGLHDVTNELDNLNFYNMQNVKVEIKLKDYTQIHHEVIKIFGIHAEPYLDINNKFPYLSKPLKSKNSIQELNKPIITLFPRFRNREDSLFRNANKDKYNNFCKIIKEKYPSSLLVKVGSKHETINIDCDIVVDDIVESIEYLKKSDLLITPNSGYFYFAKNCGCTNICVFQEGISYDYLTMYNIFNNKATFYNTEELVISEILKLENKFQNKTTKCS